METVILRPENKEQERALLAFSHALNIPSEKKSLIERIQELEDLVDGLRAERHRHEPTYKWADVKKELNKKHGIAE